VHEVFELLEGETCNVNLFLLVAIAVIRDEDRAVMRHEVEPQSNIRVSVSSSKHKSADLRQLV